MKHLDAAIISAVFAHALTWAAAIGLAVVLIYQGQSAIAVTGAAIAVESTPFKATLIEVNGLIVLPLLLAPVLLTALSSVAIHMTKTGSRDPKVTLWVSALLLLAYCLVALASYLPAGLALLVSAIITSRQGILVPIKHQDE